MKRADARLESELLTQVSAQELWKHVMNLGRLDRTSGGPGEAEAAGYIQRTLESYEIPVAVHEFNSYLSYPRLSELRLFVPEARAIDTITRSFSAATSAAGIQGELIDVGSGGPADYQAVDVHGKIVLAETASGGALNMPGAIQAAQERGALAHIHMWASGENVLHEMIASPVWGTPTLESVKKLPSIPSLAIKRADGEYLQALCRRGGVKVWLRTQVETGWRRVPLPEAVIEGTGAGQYLLIGGHLDSWYLGVTDNATGNACLLELARVFGEQRPHLRRGIKVVWWPGHSTGRYSGSTWYADNFWLDLHQRCISYLNIDSPGVKGASVMDARYNHAEVRRFVTQVIAEVTGLKTEARRPPRAGDQSFWGLGLPSLGAYRMIPEDSPERAAVGGSGGGWWWHSPDDTLDKADAQVLAADTRVYAALAWRMCNLPILPFDFVSTAEEFVDRLSQLQKEAEGNFDLQPTLDKAQELRKAAANLNEARHRLDDRKGSFQASEGINRGLMQVCRILNPVLYTVAGRYDHDPAVAFPLLPGLESVSQLAGRKASGDNYFLLTRLVRERNRVLHALAEATDKLREITTLASSK